MENMFLESISADKISEMETIKRNKEFALKLIDNLSAIFYTHHKIENGPEQVDIYCKRAANHNYYGSLSFRASKNGVRFNGTLLGYYSSKDPSFKTLGAMYEKYKDSCKGIDSFKPGDHKQVTFNIQIDPNNYREVLKDIFYLFEFNNYAKKF